MVDSSAQRLVNLANQWEKHRAPLIQQYRELKEVSEDRAVSNPSFTHILYYWREHCVVNLILLFKLFITLIVVLLLV